MVRPGHMGHPRTAVRGTGRPTIPVAACRTRPGWIRPGGLRGSSMATTTVVCPQCGAPAAPGRFACLACGALLASLGAAPRPAHPAARRASRRSAPAETVDDPADDPSAADVEPLALDPDDDPVDAPDPVTDAPGAAADPEWPTVSAEPEWPTASAEPQWPTAPV